MKRLARLAILLAAWLLAATAFAADGPAPAGLHAAAKDCRHPEQTYLTYPEWFLVFSPDEYAALLEKGRSSDFPWFRHVGQFWSGYGKVIDATRKYPYNSEYHTMIVVIGASTTVEYGLKGIYETLFGRLTELTAPPNATDEDRLAAREARDYVDFIRVRPWYEFDFASRLKQLWSDTPMSGPHLLRKWERRYLLTTEWGVKAVYGWALGKATHSAYAVPLETTVAVVKNLPSDADRPRRLRVVAYDGKESFVELPPSHAYRVLATEGNESLVELPRYHAFTGQALALAARGASFVEIAGNRGDILVSSVMPSSTPDTPGVPVLIRQPILTRPGQERRVMQVPVARLAEVLDEGTRSGHVFEHVFDY